jgi:CubicO group peptidase (beta-lactamase class C family)
MGIRPLHSAILILAVVTLVPACGTTGPSETEAEFWTRMDAFVSARMDPEGSGFAFAVMHDGSIAHARGWGMADIATGVPFSPDTPTEAASLTKQFTAVAVLMLRDEGRFTLETPIRTLLPELPAAWAAVTIHHLLTHQSGIPNYTAITGDEPEAIDGLTNQAALELVLADPTLDFPTGTSTAYSNTGYILLAMLVERLTNTTFGEYLQTNIFGPLGMSASFVNDGSRALPANAARPYDEQNRLYDYALYTYGAGGIYTTLTDYAKWDQALYTDDLLPQSTLELAWTGYTGGRDNFGYGWMTGSHRGSKSLRHGGFSTGFLNYVVRVPAKRFTYLFFSNGGVFANDGFDTWTTELMEEIFDYYL